MNRRTFIGSAATAATTAAILKNGDRSVVTTSANQDLGKVFAPNRIAVSTYSFFTFKDGSKLTIPRCSGKAWFRRRRATVGTDERYV